MQTECARGAQQFTEFAGQTNAAQGTTKSGSGGGKPDFVSRRRPGQAESTSPALSQVRLLAGQVDDADGSAIVTSEGMVNKCQVIALRRKADMADPAPGFIQHLPALVFQ